MIREGETFAVSDLLAGGPGAIAAAKRLLAEVPATPVDEAFRWTGELSAQLFADVLEP